jgi:5-oxoprolinase (ATP-hydrolysing) subunit A
MKSTVFRPPYMCPPVDLNCDLGEGEPVEQTLALLAHITSANFACGVHAGDILKLYETMVWAGESGIRAGAHPGSIGNMGRERRLVPLPLDLHEVLDGQLELWLDIAETCHVELHHIKLHGALYHAANQDRKMAAAFASWMKDRFPRVRVYGPPVGYMEPALLEMGIEVWTEFFADRGYRSDGFLVPRTEPGALITDLEAVTARLKQWLTTGTVQAVDGVQIPVRARTVSIHGDTPGSVELSLRCRDCMKIP